MKKIKIGIILVLAGVFVPLILYPFVTLRDENYVDDHFTNKKEYIGQSEIIFRKGCYICEEGKFFNHVAIPYKYIISFGIVCVGVGTGILVFSIVGKKL